MMTIYPATADDFSGNGLFALDNHCLSATIAEKLNGEYILRLELAINERTVTIANEMVIKTPAPVRYTPAVQIQQTQGETQRIYKVQTSTGQRLNLRTKPSLSSGRVIKAYSNGTEVAVSAQNGDWSTVTAPDGNNGYMWSDSLVFVRDDTPTSSAVVIGEEGKTREQLFRVSSVVATLDALEVEAQHISYDLRRNYIKKASTKGKTGADALTAVLNAAVNPHEFVALSDVTEQIEADIERKSPIAALLSNDGLVEQVGGEILRDNYTIYWMQSIGRDRGVTIAYRKNMAGMSVELDTNDLVTRIIPVGYNKKNEPIFGDPIDSQYINDYAQPYIVEYEYKDVKTGAEGFKTDAAVKAEVERLARQEFDAEIDKPVMTVSVDYVDLQQTDAALAVAAFNGIFMGDTVRIRHEDYRYDFDIRVVGYEWDVLAGDYINIELGSKPATLANIQISPSQIGDSTLSSRKIAVGAVGGVELGVDSVDGEHITNNAVSTEHLGDYVVTVNKLAANSVTAEKIEAGAINAEKISADAVTADKIAAGAVAAKHISAEAVTTDKLAANSVTAGKIAAGAVDADAIKSGSITAIKIAAKTITADSGIIDDGAIGTAQIADGSITTAKIVELSADVIKTGTLSVDRLLIAGDDGLIYKINATSSGLSMSQLTDDQYKNYINGTVIVAKSITAAQIAAQTITANEILAGTITSKQINVTELFANEATIDALNAVDIRGNGSLRLLVDGKADDDDVQALETRVSQAEQKITSDAIVSTVRSSTSYKADIAAAKAAADGIEVGGRNLLLANNELVTGAGATVVKDTESNGYILTSTNTDGWARAVTKQNISVEAGSQYTLSARFKDASEGKDLGKNSLVNIWLYQNYEHRTDGYTTITSLDGNRVILTITLDDLDGVLSVQPWFYCNNQESTNAVGNRITFYDIKFERGNRATDWTPAPEDVDSDIELLSSRVTTAEQKITPTAIVSTVTSSESYKTLSNTANTNAANISALTSRVSQAELKITPDAITATVQERLDVGSVNLISGTNNGTQDWAWSMQTGGYTMTELDTGGIRGCQLTRDNVAQSGWSVIVHFGLLSGQLVENTEYTLSVEVTSNISTKIGLNGLREPNGANLIAETTKTVQNTIAAGKWTRCEWRLKTLASFSGITVGSQVVYLTPGSSAAGVSYGFRNLKLEHGNIATAWSPAAQELFVGSEIEISKNRIKLLSPETLISIPVADSADGEEIVSIDEDGLRADVITADEINSPSIVRKVGARTYTPANAGEMQAILDGLANQRLAGYVHINAANVTGGSFYINGISGHPIEIANGTMNEFRTYCCSAPVYLTSVTLSSSGTAITNRYTMLYLLKCIINAKLGIETAYPGSDVVLRNCTGTCASLAVVQAGAILTVAGETLPAGKMEIYLGGEVYSPLEFVTASAPSAPTVTTATLTATNTRTWGGDWLSTSTFGSALYQGATGGGTLRRGCMWFDRSAISGKTIVSATLTLKRVSGIGGGGSVVVGIYGTTATGASGTPAIGAKYAEISLANGATGSVDVTSAVQALANGSIAGLMIYDGRTGTFNGKSYTYGYAKIYGTGSGAPTLNVTYK